MWSSRLFRVSLFLENASILMIWGCFSIVSNVIRSNYCCRRHTMHGNMVFSRDSIFPTPQQSGCLCVCSVKVMLIYVNPRWPLKIQDGRQDGHQKYHCLDPNTAQSHLVATQLYPTSPVSRSSTLCYDLAEIDWQTSCIALSGSPVSVVSVDMFSDKNRFVPLSPQRLPVSAEVVD